MVLVLVLVGMSTPEINKVVFKAMLRHGFQLCFLTTHPRMHPSLQARPSRTAGTISHFIHARFARQMSNVSVMAILIIPAFVCTSITLPIYTLGYFCFFVLRLSNSHCVTLCKGFHVIPSSFYSCQCAYW